MHNLKCNKNQTAQHKNSESCVITEFPINDNEINFAIAKISSRYPDTGFVTNTICKEIVYIQEGMGKIVINGVEYELNAGDSILIPPNGKFYWDGTVNNFV